MKLYGNNKLEKILGRDLKNFPALHYKDKPLINSNDLLDDKLYSVDVQKEVFDDHDLVQRFILGNHKELNPKIKPITFHLTDKETEVAQNWMEEHSKICPVSFKNGNMPTAGEHYYFKIIPTGLGPCTTVGCLYCKNAKKI